MAEDYKKVATELKERVVIAEVDCTVETEVCERYGVRGYPTLKFFVKGQPMEYKGSARTKDAIISFIERSTQPPATFLDSEADVAKFLNDHANKVVVIAYASSGSANQAQFEGAARDAGDALPSAFGIVRSRYLLGSVGSGNTNDEDIVVRRSNGELAWIPFGEDLAQRVLAAAIPDVNNFGAENAQMYSRV